MLLCFLKRLSLTAGIVAFTGGFAVAAPVGIEFDFTTTASVSDPLQQGNTWTFKDVATGNYELKASAWAGGPNDLQPATVVGSSTAGLGVCSSADGSIKRCLQNPASAVLERRGGEKWLLLILPEPMVIESFDFVPAASNNGRIRFYTGLINPAQVGNVPLSQLGFDSPLSYAYRRISGEQSVEAGGADLRNALLVSAGSGNTRFTLSGLRAAIVPLPASAWLLISGLAVLVASSYPRRRPA